MPLELNSRASFIDFCQGLLNLNPVERWTPQQARQHPFITGEKFTKAWSVSGVDQSFAIYHSDTTPAATHTPRPPTLPSTPDHTHRPQATIRWFGTLATKGNSGVPRRCFLQPTLGSTPSLYGASIGSSEHFRQQEPLYQPTGGQRTTCVPQRSR